ncbi:MAG: hypothetical protein GAK30_03480 [Paracidovorax wautersii]|uniref:Phenol degradation protein meta n=1 Tax=Paracidovorax wautersii TaxID=1177982 RepID=A0A7V8JP59_9BURK|nr:MAG: hypothetical protein GAK30_03480 [Paracidovorax wautersii]
MKTLLSCTTLALALPCLAQQIGAPPPSVAQPSGLNLGGTSFSDGMAGPPGWSYLAYLKYTEARSIRDGSGQANTAFNNPRLDVTTLINQFSYYSPDTFAHGAHFGWSVIVPVVSIHGRFGSGGAQLTGNGTALGDITTGPQVQFDPVEDANGRPLYVQRLALDVIVPTGKYDANQDLNPGSNFWSVNPYWAASWMPLPRWDFSWRLNYLYNARNDAPASSSPTPYLGQTVRSTRAGQTAWVNFAAAYAVTPTVSAGLSGYYLQQLTDDKVNGQRLSGSRERVLGIGPGLFWRVSPARGLWLNTYREMRVENRARNKLVLQLRLAQAF